MVYRPRRGASGETNPARTLVVHVQLLGREKQTCCLGSPVCGALSRQPKQTKTGGDGCGEEKLRTRTVRRHETRVVETGRGRTRRQVTCAKSCHTGSQHPNRVCRAIKRSQCLATVIKAIAVTLEGTLGPPHPE